MDDKPNKKYWVIFVIGAILAPLLFSSSSLKPWSGSNKSVGLIHEILTPIQTVWHKTTSAVEVAWENYLFLSDKTAEVDRLKEELRDTNIKLLDYEKLQSDIHRLRSLLGLKEKIKAPTKLAEVISANLNDGFYDMIRINIGASDSVSVGMTVITDKGIVGKILRIGWNYADVQLVTDNNYSLDVIISRTRVRAILKGVGGGLASLSTISHITPRINDTIMSSGLVDGTPKGIPVGRIVKIHFGTDDTSKEITVQPWIDISKIEEVIVILQQDVVLQKIVEAAGDRWLDTPFKKVRKRR